MSRAAAIIEVVRSALAALETLPPAERDLVTRAIVSDLRARDPECVSPLTLGPPTERIVDPRTKG